MTNAPWTPAENAALVSLYFAMLDRATAGQPYNKAAMLRVARGDTSIAVEHFAQAWAGKLADRSKGSIEAKLMNASAAHADLCRGAETMASHGYKAWGNYQAALKDAMSAELNSRAGNTYADGHHSERRMFNA